MEPDELQVLNPRSSRHCAGIQRGKRCLCSGFCVEGEKAWRLSHAACESHTTRSLQCTTMSHRNYRQQTCQADLLPRSSGAAGTQRSAGACTGATAGAQGKGTFGKGKARGLTADGGTRQGNGSKQPSACAGPLGGVGGWGGASSSPYLRRETRQNLPEEEMFGSVI